MEKSKELLPTDTICNRVYNIRGQQVKRNISRFPEDFMFRLEWEEIPEECLKSQIVTSNERGKDGR